MTGTVKFGFAAIAFVILYGIYMFVIRFFLIKKSSRKIWKTFIPVLSVHEEYAVAGRPGWFWWHAVTMVPASVFMALGFAALVESYTGLTPDGLTRSQVSRLSVALITVSVLLFLVSLPARFAKAYGLQRNFGEKPNLDYAFGLVVFPWSFKARLAFSKAVVYAPKKTEKEKIKIHVPHFFPEYRSTAGNSVPKKEE